MSPTSQTNKIAAYRRQDFKGSFVRVWVKTTSCLIKERTTETAQKQVSKPGEGRKQGKMVFSREVGALKVCTIQLREKQEPQLEGRPTSVLKQAIKLLLTGFSFNPSISFNEGRDVSIPCWNEWQDFHCQNGYITAGGQIHEVEKCTIKEKRRWLYPDQVQRQPPLQKKRCCKGAASTNGWIGRWTYKTDR